MNITKIIVCILALVWTVTCFAEVRMYRYIDDNGQTVIRSSIAPGKVALGYDILDSKGRIIETVDALEENASELYLENQKKERTRRKQEEYDLSLIRRYSFVKDIEVERDRKINELKIRVSILKGNLNGVRSELESAYDSAAKRERKGQKITSILQGRIDNLEAKITSTEDVLTKRQKAIKTLENNYIHSIKRFSEIQALRRR